MLKFSRETIIGWAKNKNIKFSEFPFEDTIEFEALDYLGNPILVELTLEENRIDEFDEEGNFIQHGVINNLSFLEELINSYTYQTEYKLIVDFIVDDTFSFIKEYKLLNKND